MSETNLSALSAFGVGMAVSANNIANMNTEGFKASRVDYQTGPDGQGVAVGGILRDESPGPLIGSLVQSTDQATGRVEFLHGLTEGSNVDPASEFVRMIETQRAFEANIAAVRADEQMSGVVLNLLV